MVAGTSVESHGGAFHRGFHGVSYAWAAIPDAPSERGYRGLAALAARRHVTLDITAPPKGRVGFAPLYNVEHAFAQLGRWRRLSRCCEGTEARARAWLDVASFGYLLGRL